MTTYSPFTEDNEWEGETWFFWLQVEGNEEALQELFEILAKYKDELDSYTLDLNYRESEEGVTALERNATMGYMQSDIVVEGKLVIPEFHDVKQLDRLLYKGGIEFWFKEVW